MVALLLVVSAFPAADDVAPPPFRNRRQDEDYSYLRDESARSGAWWEAAKRIPLDDSGCAFLSLGGKLRARYERYENDAWGDVAAADHDDFWLRALPYADLRIGEPFRFFTQCISAFELDDGTSRTEALWTIYATHEIDLDSPAGIDAYFFAGPFIDDSGLDETVHFAALELRLRF